MIKWEHSIFALPFALCGAMLAAGGSPTAHQLVWIVVAMVSARSAAMAFNRVADATIDAAQSAYPYPGAAGRCAYAGIRHDIRGGRLCDLHPGRCAAESPDT